MKIFYYKLFYMLGTFVKKIEYVLVDIIFKLLFHFFLYLTYSFYHSDLNIVSAVAIYR